MSHLGGKGHMPRAISASSGKLRGLLAPCARSRDPIRRGNDSFSGNDLDIHCCGLNVGSHSKFLYCNLSSKMMVQISWAFSRCLNWKGRALISRLSTQARKPEGTNISLPFCLVQAQTQREKRMWGVSLHWSPSLLVVFYQTYQK